MNKRLKYGDIEKTSYIKNILTLILIIAFMCVSGRFLYKHIKQELLNKANTPVKQGQIIKETEVTQEPKQESVVEPVKINAEETLQINVKAEKEKILPQKPTVKDDTVRTQLKEHVTQNKKPVTNIKYAVYVGSYTSREQANQARDVMLNSYNDLSPVVKQLSADNYSLLIGTYNSKSTAETIYGRLKNDFLPVKLKEE